MKSVRWIAPILLAVLLAVAGCSLARPSVAAEVNGVVISEAELESATMAVSAAVGGDPVQVRPVVLQYLVLGALSRAVSEQEHLGLTDAQREQSARASRLAQLMDDPTTREFALNGGDFTFVTDKLGSIEAFQQKVAAMSVRINPRHGSWNPATLLISGQGGGLSQALPTPSPTATP